MPNPPFVFESQPLRPPGFPPEERITVVEDGRTLGACETLYSDALGIISDLHGSSEELASALLAEASARLVSRGATKLKVAAASGWAPGVFLHDDPALSTWSSVVEPSSADWPLRARAPGPLEHRSVFEAAGFRPTFDYVDWIVDTSETPGDARAVADRVAQAGLSLRPFDLSRSLHESRLLYYGIDLGLAIGNPDPVALDRACHTYMLVMEWNRLDPEFLLLVLDRNEKVCGYGLAYVDPTQAAGEKQLVVANIAAKREVRGHGIAHHIVDRLRWTARVRGLTEMKLAVVPAMGAGPRIAARQGALESSRYATWERDV